MSQFMRQEAVSVGRPRLVLTASEDDVATDGIGSRMDILGRIFGLPSRVHADVAKVVSEAGLHESSSLGVERPPGGSKRRVDRVRYLGWRSCMLRRPFCLQRDRVGRIRLTLTAGATAIALSLKLHTRSGVWRRSCRFRRAHDLIRYPVGFLFMSIARRVHRELGLERRARGGETPEDRLIAKGLVKRGERS